MTFPSPDWFGSSKPGPKFAEKTNNRTACQTMMAVPVYSVTPTNSVTPSIKRRMNRLNHTVTSTPTPVNKRCNNSRSLSLNLNAKVVKNKYKMDTFKFNAREKFKERVVQHMTVYSGKTNLPIDTPSSISYNKFTRNNSSLTPKNYDLLNIVKSKGLNAIPSWSNQRSFFQLNSSFPNIERKSCSLSNNSSMIQSRVDEIQAKWDLPQESNLFKSSIEKRLDLVYSSASDDLVHSMNSTRESKIKEKVNFLDYFRNDRLNIVTTLKSSIKSFFSRDFFTWGQKSRQYIPYAKQDHVVSDEAYVDFTVKIEVEDKLPILTPEMEAEVLSVLNSPNCLIVKDFAIDVHTRDLLTLWGSNWLNDTVIEFYLNLIALRSKRGDFQSVYAFSTFFYTRLAKGSQLGRWANKLDFFSYELLIVPVHASSHWRLAIVDNKYKRIEYYDSLGLRYNECVDLLAGFLQNESLTKKKTELDMSQWSKVYSVEGIPHQNNSFDCGVFLCKYADYIARRRPISFTQDHIPYFRKCMIYEIMHKNLLTK